MGYKKRKQKAVISFEHSLKASMGSKWNGLTNEQKEVIREMSQCQDKGGPVGSRAVEHVLD
jgi:phage tail tape-measure protein